MTGFFVQMCVCETSYTFSTIKQLATLYIFMLFLSLKKEMSYLSFCTLFITLVTLYFYVSHVLAGDHGIYI